MGGPWGFIRFSKTERKGIAFLGLIIVLLILANFLSVDNASFGELNEDEVNAEVKAFYASIEEVKAPEYQKRYSRNNYNDEGNRSGYSNNRRQYRNYQRYDNDPEPERFDFDPNTLDKDGWKRLGFSEKQASAMMKYIDKAGPFTKKEDLLRLFTIDSSLYAELEPFVTIDTSLIADSVLRDADPGIPDFIAANSADAKAWNTMGIEWKLSYDICNYRDKLGGFHSKEQLLEVEGMRSTLYDSLYPKLELSGQDIKKINVNDCRASDLRYHPYIGDWDIANQIVNTRDRFGPYQRLNDVRRLPLVSDELFMWIKPYISVE